MTLQRTVTFHPAWDKRHDDPSKNYGVHGVQIDFVLKSDTWAVTFALYTDWVLPKTRAWWNTLPQRKGCGTSAGATVVCRTTPQYDDQVPGDCLHLGSCYSDTAFCIGHETFFPALIERGEDGLWEEMEKWATAVFKEAVKP